MSRFEGSNRIRLLSCLAVFVVIYTTLVARAWQLQLTVDQRVARVQEKQLDRHIVLSPPRGTIYDSQSRALAVNLQVPSIFADPRLVTDPRLVSRKLALLLGISSSEIFKKLKDKNRRFVWIKRHVDPIVKTKLEDWKLDGVATIEEGTRLYPGRQLAAQLLGAVGSDGEGLAGLERQYDRYLRSQKLVVQTQKDAKGRSIFGEDKVVLEPEPGADLYSTIDTIIQHAVEKELYEAAQKSHSQRAMALVMDPNNGNILAIASYPSVNPNRLDLTKPEWLRNRPVEDMFEPGSTFKVFSLAAALEANAISSQQYFLCKTGSLKVSGKVIRTHEPHDWLTPGDILKYSDNIGTSRIAFALGSERLYAGLRKFGFGGTTGIDFSHETKGSINSANQWRDVDLANISFGQGVGVTAVQLVSALSVIANGGHSVQPHLVEKIRFADGREVPMAPPNSGQPILSQRTIGLIRSWMESVTSRDGTGVQAAIPGYRVAGKTGTAQKIDGATRNYSTQKVVSSFMGFVPASKPRLAGIFIFDEPAKADYGGTLAAPVFKNAMQAALTYLNVPPDRSQEERPASLVANSRDESPRKTDWSDSEYLPDVRGLTVREVLSRAHQLPVDVRIVGSGVAVRQVPNAGKRMTQGQRLEVYFEQEAERGDQT